MTLQRFEKDFKETAITGIINGGLVALISRFAFDERGLVTVPLVNMNVDIMIPLAIAGVASSVFADTFEVVIRDNLNIPLQYQKIGNFAVKAVTSGGSLALATWGLIGLDDMQNALMTAGVGLGSKFGADYIADNVVLKNKEGFIL